MHSQPLAPKDLETRFWLRSVAIGGWACLIVGVVGLAYVLIYAEGAHQLAIGASIGAVVAMGAAALWLIPWDRFARSRVRELLVLSWALAIVGAITLMAALDGGAKSPLALAIVLPSIFASLAFTRARVLLVGVAAEAGFGLLCLIGSPGGGTAMVGAVVLGAAITIGARQADFHQEWRRRLAHHSSTDPLTGLLNRRGFAAGWRRAPASDGGTPRMTLVLIDLDLFKDYNDVHGHQAGDDLLCWVGAELRATVRSTDSVARLGGDEFAVLLPDTDARSAAPLVERIEERLAARAPHSLGTASTPEDGAALEDLYRVADAGLYKRKLTRSGGTRLLGAPL
jgi:diguanylate cyclase (GGDEF)-like protein